MFRQNLFDFLQDNMENHHETENDNDLNKLKVPPCGRTICKTIWLTEKPLINMIQRCTSVNIIA